MKGPLEAYIEKLVMSGVSVLMWIGLAPRIQEHNHYMRHARLIKCHV